MLIGRAPVRISFAGGGTDFSDYYDRFGGMVVSASINKYFYLVVRPRKDNVIQIISSDYRTMSTVDAFDVSDTLEGPLSLPKAVLRYLQVKRGLDIFLASEIPPGTGLGSSGAVAVNLVNTLAVFNGGIRTKSEAAERAFAVETGILNMPVGKQDQYAAAHGGLNAIYFHKDGVQVEPIGMDAATRDQFEARIMLFFTGATRNSASILRQQKSQTGESDSRTIEALHNIKALANETKQVLEAGQLDRFGEILHQGWLNKKKLVSGITNERIDRIYETARERGALGGKITGAGGGGFLMLYCPQDRQSEVRAALESEGLQEMSFSFDYEGAAIVMQSSFFDE